MPIKARTTNEKGLGWPHRRKRDALFRSLTDGSPCDWCDRPRYHDRKRNYDYDPDSTNPTSGVLQADHSDVSRAEAIRRGIPIPLPNRLLHGDCNRQRGDGANDHLAAVATERKPAGTETTKLLMAWPW